jgi:hypothetical protein
LEHREAIMMAHGDGDVPHASGFRNGAQDLGS